MKIKVSETVNVTEIEASAQDLRESNTLHQNMQNFLNRLFKSHEPIYDEAYDPDESEEEEEATDEQSRP